MAFLELGRPFVFINDRLDSVLTRMIILYANYTRKMYECVLYAFGGSLMGRAKRTYVSIWPSKAAERSYFGVFVVALSVNRTPGNSGDHLFTSY